MNALEQPLRKSHEKPGGDAPPTSRAASKMPRDVHTKTARREHREFPALAFVVFLSAIVLLIHFLRSRMGHFPLPPQEFDGLGVVGCALAYVALFLWRLGRAFKRDAEQVEASEKPLEISRAVETEINSGK